MLPNATHFAILIKEETLAESRVIKLINLEFYYGVLDLNPVESKRWPSQSNKL